MRSSIFFTVVVGLFLFCFCLQGGENLIVNGGLEKGEGNQAPGWSGIDGLMTRRVKREDGRGYCLRMDTSVLRSEKKIWLISPEKYVRKTGPRGQYDTVGAHEGVWAWASPVDLKKGWRYYVLEADVRCLESKAMPKILVRGYRKITASAAGQNSSWFHVHHPGGPAYSEQFGKENQRRKSREGDYLMVYRHTLHCDLQEPGKWGHFKLGIQLPSIRSAIPERILLKPYAFWPNGTYEFDNLVFRKAGRDEVTELRKGNARRRH